LQEAGYFDIMGIYFGGIFGGEMGILSSKSIKSRWGCHFLRRSKER